MSLLFGWLVPSSQRWGVMPLVGTIGAVIMPHNLYLHSGLVLSRKIKRESRQVRRALPPPPPPPSSPSKAQTANPTCPDPQTQIASPHPIDSLTTPNLNPQPEHPT